MMVRDALTHSILTQANQGMEARAKAPRAMRSVISFARQSPLLGFLPAKESVVSPASWSAEVRPLIRWRTTNPSLYRMWKTLARAICGARIPPALRRAV